ncbi:MAG TPA: hypothetical protein V6C78_01290 [Crinalium sp.]|jgi:hypothetical protein
MTQQQQLDLIIVAIYLISVAYVLFQAINSVEDQTTISFNKGAVTKQIEEQNLQDVIDVNVKFDGKYKYDNQPKELAVTVENKSKTKAIEVDWDRSSIITGGRARRIIRLSQDKRIDLFQRQVFSMATPGLSLQEKVTAEDLLKVNPDTGVFEVTGPIVDIAKMKKDAAGKKAGDKARTAYEDFASLKTTVKFAMRLVVRIYDLMGAESDRLHALTCDFEIKKVPWTDFLPK